MPAAYPPIRAEEIAVVTPTKGRHRQLTKLLETLGDQTVRIGQIVIADGGGDAEPIVAAFADRLPVVWLDCPTPGQIAQRNFALGKLDAGISVVIYFDDDIQLAPDAIERLIDCWNTRESEPTGMSFNITNMAAQPDSIFRSLFFMRTMPRGRVLKSGYNTPLVDLPASIRSHWLIGGATAWRRETLSQHANRPIPSRWAITEDLMYSYGLHKEGAALYGCSDARVLHIDNAVPESFATGVFRGRNATLWRYMFVADNPELSKPRFFWMMGGQAIARLGLALAGRPQHLGYFVGHLQGLGLSLLSIVGGRDIRDFLK